MLIAYGGSYYALFDRNRVTFRVGVGAPLAAYRIQGTKWCDMHFVFGPMDRLDLILRPARHRHLCAGMGQFVGGPLQANWWEAGVWTRVGWAMRIDPIAARSRVRQFSPS